MVQSRRIKTIIHFLFSHILVPKQQEVEITQIPSIKFVKIGLKLGIQQHTKTIYVVSSLYTKHNSLKLFDFLHVLLLFSSWVNFFLRTFCPTEFKIFQYVCHCIFVASFLDKKEYIFSSKENIQVVKPENGRRELQGLSGE